MVLKPWNHLHFQQAPACPDNELLQVLQIVFQELVMPLENGYATQIKNRSLNIPMCIYIYPSVYPSIRAPSHPFVEIPSILCIWKSHTLHSSDAPQGSFCPSGDAWQSLQTFLVFITRGNMGCHWHPVNQIQECCFNSLSAQAAS